jgi:hypothetical protein
MCTVSIQRTDSGFTATMNRDEAYSRAPERKPEIRSAAHGDWAAPFDGEKGGTWMGASTWGVAACIMNAYQPGESLLPDTTGRFRTRGEIVPAVLAAGDGDSAQQWVKTQLDPVQYPSFTLLVATPDETAIYEWLGKGSLAVVTHRGEWLVRSSSGWDSAEVTRWRDERFARWIAEGAPHRDALPSFHLLQEPGHEERSPLMRREWSATRSITQARIRTGDGRIDLRYWPAPTPEACEPAAHCSFRLAAAPAKAR